MDFFVIGKFFHFYLMFLWKCITWHTCPFQTGWRHVRIQQTGKNASGQTHYLSLSGLELYGTVTGVCEDLGRAAKEAEANLRRQRRLVKSQVRCFSPGFFLTTIVFDSFKLQVIEIKKHFYKCFKLLSIINLYIYLFFFFPHSCVSNSFIL